MRSGADWEDVGERMRVARLAASLTQEELSARAGLDRTMLVKIESGVRRIDAMELIRLSSALGAAGLLAASRKLSEPAVGSVLDALRATGLRLPVEAPSFPVTDASTDSCRHLAGFEPASGEIRT
jgi:transcriptional regulator with XRE-family HTH domain